ESEDEDVRLRPSALRRPLPSGRLEGLETRARPDIGWGQRWSNRKNPGLYIEDVERRGNAIESSENLDERQARGEFVFLGLRCLSGFEAACFEGRFGCDPEAAFPHLARLRVDGLLQFERGRWSLTE